MLMKLKYWRGKNDGLNSLAYSMRFVDKKPLYTHLMIESRLLVPKTIKMSTETSEPLIDIGKAILSVLLSQRSFKNRFQSLLERRLYEWTWEHDI